jgi:predicted enzyme related to lactoylglutathione lyase
VTDSDSPLSAARLRYLFLTVRDLATSLAFYRDAIGLAVEYEEPGRLAFLRFGTAGQSLALYAGRADAPADTEPHWFAALDVDDLDAAVGALRDRGVAVGDPFDVPAGRAAKLRDPDGNVLELHEPER